MVAGPRRATARPRVDEPLRGNATGLERRRLPVRASALARPPTAVCTRARPLYGALGSASTSWRAAFRLPMGD